MHWHISRRADSIILSSVLIYSHLLTKMQHITCNFYFESASVIIQTVKIQDKGANKVKLSPTCINSYNNWVQLT